MTLSSVALAQDRSGDRVLVDPHVDAVTTAGNSVSWAAIIAGAAGAAALSLILLILGSGLGLSSVSPWAFEGMGAKSFGISAILWVTFTQLAASAIGGYLAGRLRNKVIGIPADEDFFRDTAHGFLAWAVATLATAALLTSTIGAIVNGGVQMGAAVAGGAAAATVAAAGSTVEKTDGDAATSRYFVDSLFRGDVSATSSGVTPGANAGSSTEVTRIFANSMQSAMLPADDTRYVGQLVAQRTGLPQADAEKRVTDTFARLHTQRVAQENTAKEAADKARTASAYAALWLFISLLIGAFIASLSATYGGKLRDA